MEPINWYGTYSLTLREVKRFIRVYNQTLITPAISALIFLAVFALAVGAKRHEINGIKFINFMGYGLIIMSIVQNAFGNSSSSLIMSKIIGYISDILTPPLGSKEIIIAFTLGAVLRGLMVGIIVTISLIPFVEFTLYHPLLLAFYILASCTLLGKLGILSGMIANSFDQHSAITSYLITPLSFLSGTFYSVKDLPQILQQINFLNPFFYMIDGFRYCLTNKADGNIIVGICFLVISNIIIYLMLEKLIDKGWRIKN
ncbi:MAG: ABC transporter permease [Rickettsiaceae bacterium]|jgi:ABC-2 type transport system permease protein|nr:ABC transporter permease [Rickettsiaceae bacterium]MCP5378074.1 ABC transporter permease [Rickettsiaceae bacterium]